MHSVVVTVVPTDQSLGFPCGHLTSAPVCGLGEGKALVLSELSECDACALLAVRDRGLALLKGREDLQSECFDALVAIGAFPPALRLGVEGCSPGCLPDGLLTHGRAPH